MICWFLLVTAGPLGATPAADAEHPGGSEIPNPEAMSKGATHDRFGLRLGV